MSQLLDGAFHGQWVEVEGRVRNVHFGPREAGLEIAAEGGSFTAITLRQPGTHYEAFVDSLVRVKGNAGPVFNQSRQMVAVHVFFPSLRELRVIQAAPRDPFSAPAVPVSQLFRFSPVPELLHRVHVRGTVTLDWPGRILCIQDGEDGICMQTTQAAGVALSANVDVVGFPAIDRFKPTLEDASFRVIDRPSASSPRPIAPADALKGGLDGQLVEIDAELIGQDAVSDDPALILRAGPLVFTASLPKGAVRSEPPWKEGSILRIAGICSEQLDPRSANPGEGEVRPESMNILLRSLRDVTVLHAPSWWTPWHTLETFAAIGPMTLAAMAWIVVLRQRVAKQTRALRTSEERLRHLSEHDVLTGLPNRLLLNDRLRTALERAKRFHTCLGLLMVDVDGFKEVNDTLGHQSGDKLLCALAERLLTCVRATDTVARIGGDEFIVLLADLRVPAEAETIVDVLVVSVTRPFAIDHALTSISVSVGVVTYPECSSDSEVLMCCADQAMYVAKQKGKNRFQVFRPDQALTIQNHGKTLYKAEPAPQPSSY
jgi:diguanylate cyclase (GGDEF)-like protein